MQEPPLTLYGDVGPLSGPIRHPGDVRILGSVAPGFGVTAGGSLLVSRDVRNATLVAGGDVAVNGAVTGTRTLVDAIGSVRLRQASDARVISGGDIHVRVAADRAELDAAGWVRVSGEPGLLRAGRVRAGIGVECFRVETGVGEPPVIEIGGLPFEKTADEVREKLAFVTEQIEKARSRPAPTDTEFRRRASDLIAYGQLAEKLRHRLAQVERVAAAPPAPTFRVLGGGRVRARLRLGPLEDALEELQERWTGRFQLELDGERAKVTQIREALRVG